MTVEIGWSLDYCLACDKQTSGGAYCCQSCRLADLSETSSSESEPITPIPTTLSAASTRGTGALMSLAFDQASYEPTKARSVVPLSQQVSSQAAVIDATPSNRALSPSSSRSSLSSDSSKTSQSRQLSAQARSELRGYSNSFDLIRNWRRGMNTP